MPYINNNLAFVGCKDTKFCVSTDDSDAKRLTSINFFLIRLLRKQCPRSVDGKPDGTQRSVPEAAMGRPADDKWQQSGMPPVANAGGTDAAPGGQRRLHCFQTPLCEQPFRRQNSSTSVCLGCKSTSPARLTSLSVSTSLAAVFVPIISA